MTASERMEDNKCAITDPLRQAVIDLLVQGIHPQVQFAQVNDVLRALSNLKPVSGGEEVKGRVPD